MDKNKYIDQEIQKLTKFWGSFALISGAIFFILLSTLDYFITPQNFLTFLVYRLVCAFLMITLFLFYRQNISKIFQNIIIISAAVLTSSTVELMILSFGGHQSTYYAGIILTIVFMLGIIPFPFKMSLVIVSVAYSIYLLPILIFDHITNIQIFINNNAFLLSTFMIALVWRFLSQKSLINELGLQYELDKDKRELETYSTQLEQLVAERTKELNKSELMFRSLFEYATDGIMILDRNGKILNVNQAACEIHGFDRDALIGTNIELLETEENKRLLKEQMERILNGESLLFETQHYRKDGSKISLEVSSKAIEVEGNILIQSFHRDITEKKKIQEQLAHSQKMESIGLLAGGIAHNFNNILTAILGYTELLCEDSNLDDTSKKRLRNIEGAARKATEMVSKLLSFARRDRHEILPLNLHDVINDTVKLIKGVLDKRIEINMDLSNETPVVEGDPNQLEQIIMNLIVNAKDAMPDGGVISIKTHVTEVKRDIFDMPSYITPGRYVVLTMSDTGCGIPEEKINRIFEPFYTTKERGKGTGLGLAMVYGIVKDHKGYITVQSEAGKGTTFDVYLPVSGKPIHEAIKEQNIFSAVGHGNILVVDDEEDVLNFIKDILEMHGYKALPSNNPLGAIDIFKKLAGEIELVITDIIMPLMEGKELIRNLKTIKPDIKIIAISGYSDEVISKDKMMIDEFLRKPFEGSLLISAVRRLLNTVKLK